MAADFVVILLGIRYGLQECLSLINLLIIEYDFLQPYGTLYLILFTVLKKAGVMYCVIIAFLTQTF